MTLHTEPLLKQLMEYGGYFIEADLPSPLMGYPGALGIDLTAEAGDFDKILAKVESTIVEKAELTTSVHGHIPMDIPHLPALHSMH